MTTHADQSAFTGEGSQKPESTSRLTPNEAAAWAAWQSIPQVAFRPFDHSVDVDRFMAYLSAYEPWMTRSQAQNALRGLVRKGRLSSPEMGRFARAR